MKKINPLSMVLREMENQHVRPSDLAHKLSRSNSAMGNMLKKESIQVQRLVELSELFQYNFFAEIAAELSLATPDYVKLCEKAGHPVTFENKDSAEMVELRDRVKMLEMEVTILRQTLKDVIAG
jgi:hypothetical protein